jgi:SAM-dependent methyltransferase
MLLVRWLATELRVFAYLQNGVLVATFLGLALGSRNSRAPARLLPAVLALMAVAFVIRDPWDWGLGEGVTQGLIAFQDSVVWYGLRGSTPNYIRTSLMVFSMVVSFGLLAALALAFRPLGQWLGAWMDTCPRPIAAYTVNIFGSLLGIAGFVAATAFVTPPWLWLMVGGIGLALCAPYATDAKPIRILATIGALSLPVFAWAHGSPAIWSPYQKLTIERRVAGLLDRDCGEVILVNNVGYQIMVDVDPAHQARSPELYPPAEIRSSHYVLPYELIGRRERVLVVGAGSGNDVAAALRGGAGSVQAVEIDPAIVEIGRNRHPNHPYASDRVKVTVDDARAFFGRDTRKYDLVWFGLLDSHTTASAYANVRLDHFVYTRESFAAVKELLAPNGVVVLFFVPQTEWIAERLVRMLGETFGEPPIAMDVRSSTACLGWGGLMLVGGSKETLAPLRGRALADPDIRTRLTSRGSRDTGTALTTDNWPYLYLPGPGIPRYHLLVAGASLILLLVLRRRLFKPGEAMEGSMLLMGTGFMLLEVTGVSRAALLFGTTWTVNAYVVGAILGMILIANFVASRVSLEPRGWPAWGLLASLLLLALLPPDLLAALPIVPRVIVGAGFLALPVLFSGLIFVSAWARAPRRDLALGSNLLGSLVGGVATMLSMAIGFRALMFLTLVVYAGAILALRRFPASTVVR